MPNMRSTPSSLLALAALLLLCLLAPAHSPAVIFGGEHQECDLATGKTFVDGTESTGTLGMKFSADAHKVEGGIRMGKEGRLNESAVETPPFSVGISGRPLTVTNVEVTVDGSGFGPSDLRVSCRFSTTGEKWSDWMALKPTSGAMVEAFSDKPAYPSYSGMLAVPRTQQESYNRFWDEWAYKPGLNQWHGDNVDEYLKFLGTRHPEALRKEIPLIRQLQTRVEYLDTKSPLLRRIRTKTSWGVSGLKQ
jgi:hypothetical protein